MRERVDAADPRGRVAAIQVRPARRVAPVALDAWDPRSSDDHARSADRAVTLFQAEHLPAIAALLRRPVTFDQVRRNVLVAGLNLETIRGRRFAIGEVVLEGTKPCDPCERMEEALGRGGYAAMLGHGGWCARIVTPGVIRVGDEVRLVIGG